MSVGFVPIKCRISASTKISVKHEGQKHLKSTSRLAFC